MRIIDYQYSVMTSTNGSKKIPVTLLTGFLGSGKSTLLSNLLNDQRFENTAVVVNEFGATGLDGLLIQHAEEQIVEMTSGCLCCTVRGDIHETLMMLSGKREKEQISKFDRLVIETTGLADPAPVIHTLMNDPLLDRRYFLGGVVTTIDALSGVETLNAHFESQKQAAVADRIVVTKTDLLEGASSNDRLSNLRELISSLNHLAPIIDPQAPEFSPNELFNTSLYDPETKGMNVRRWLNSEAEDFDHHQSHDSLHSHEHSHSHDISRHGSDIRSFTLTFNFPIDVENFATSIEALTILHGSNLLRIKGVIKTKDQPNKPLVIHGVQHIFHDPIWLDAWPDSDEKTRLVFITKGIERQSLEDYFKAWLDQESIQWS